MANKIKIEFIVEFAGKQKGFIGEYSKNNADYLINNNIGVEYKEPKEEKKEPKPKSTKK